jgi:hypothetical protein
VREQFEFIKKGGEMNAASGMPTDTELLAIQEDDKTWLLQALALLDAISMGELLSALPEADDDRERHQAGVNLLGILEAQLKARLAGVRRTSKH